VNASAVAPLVFSWDPPRKRRRALIVFLILSVALHALCFYIFQIVYPPTIALMPPPARVTLISPDDPESLALLRWVEAEDPALTTTTQRLPEAKSLVLPPIQHRPSYASHQPNIENTSSTDARSQYSKLGRNRAGSPSASESECQRSRAGAQNDGEFCRSTCSLGDPVFADFKFRLTHPDAPANARFRVAIDEHGAIRFCFLIESSGDPALDEQARNFLQLCRLKTKENSPVTNESALFWTTATILWGNDFVPTSSPSATPSP
jgi:hypothetical protein